MTKILVTGSTGFIGKHLVPKLSSVGHEVVGVNSGHGDIAEASTWTNYPAAEVVVHLAGRVSVPNSWEDPYSFIKCNLLGTVALLDYCRKHAAKLVFFSSYLYGNPRTLPIPESAPLNSNNPYALSKKLAEEACRFYSDSFGINITILRPFNVYGPGQPEDFIIPCIIRQIRSGDAILIKDLDPKRDYVYIDDVVDSVLKSVDYPCRFGIFNIGSGASYSVEEVIKIIQSIKGTNLPVRSTSERRKDEVLDTVADIAEAKQRLGWSPHWTLEQGMRQILQEAS